MTENFDVYCAIDNLAQVTVRHNKKFDEANQIFTKAEEQLCKVAVDHWDVFHLTPRPTSNSAIQIQPLVFPQYQPFQVINYQLGFFSKRLVTRKIVSNFDYCRDYWGNVVFYPNQLPVVNKISSSFDEPIAVSESSREIRVMVIENLPRFLNNISSAIENHTNSLNMALGSQDFSYSF